MLVDFELFKRRIKTRGYRRWMFGRFVILLAGIGCVALIVFASTTASAGQEQQEPLQSTVTQPPAPEISAPQESAEPLLTEPQDKQEAVTEPSEAESEKAQVSTVQQMAVKTVEPLEHIGEFRITHYCACERCCGKSEDDPWYGITATGTVATEGRTIAVDPDVIPYGSEVAVFYEDGRICHYIAEDCGGAIDGLEVDVFIADHNRAWALGVMSGSVYIVNEE